jgi:DNA-binding transcriptional ArsR family regulator
MKTVLIENIGNEQRAYDSLLIEPKEISILNNALSIRIIKELVKNPSCALDLARGLKEHEQKIYYHIRKLENSGIIKLVGSEKRFGMTAKIYDVVSPVVATKLYDDGLSLKATESLTKNLDMVRLMHPFVVDGKLNAKIIIGNPYPHGKYEKGSADSPYVADLALFLGNMVSNLEMPCYKLDDHVREKDLKNNLILIGNPQFNTITEKVNKHLPVYFDEKKNWAITSRSTGNSYTDDFMGVVIKCPNPFNPEKKLLILAGKRSRGTIASIIAATQQTKNLINDNSNTNEFARIVKGIDKEGDGFIDTVKFIE